MDLRTYAILLGLLSEVALTTDQGTPDFDKIASITGHTRDTVKVYLAPGAEFPRWLKLMNYVGEKINSKLPEGSVGRILKERREQLTKHDRSIQHDVMYNNHYQLSEAASLLCWVDQEDYGNEIIAPVNWDQKLFEVMMNKPYHDRLILAGALIAAELDRLDAIAPTKENTDVTC